MKKYLVFYLGCFCLTISAQQSNLKVGDSLYQLGNYSKAISFYKQSNSARSLHKIAKTYNSIGNHDKSIAAYKQAIEKDSNLIIAQYELGKLFIKKKRNKEAQEVFERLYQKDSLNPNYSYYLGFIEKDDSISLGHFKRSFNLDTSHLKSIYRISRHFLVHEDRDSLFYYSNIGLEQDENYVDLINLQSQYLFNRGWHEEVLPLLKKLIDLGQKSETIRKRLAITYYQLDDFEKSLPLFLELIKSNPNEAGYQTYVGNIYKRKKMPKEALPFYENALKIKNPSVKTEYLALARNYLDLNDEVKATQFMDKAFREKPYIMYEEFMLLRIIDNRFTDPNVKLNFFLKYKKRYPKANDRFMEWIKSRITEYKGQIHAQKK
ncbi:tetratricopeptide repeat protein [Spongiivirga citrea]|uniref:Tetratricopeptide repeat protein n=1 Tax=Spongiivirga citrea TaxID=1481457 RepID=A0A6M0CG92_9FLAO|nr:tetratricopeptide repeat protein [Spongiivirga citrea]NER16898.1 tetratricopeptide repeat protein [Spongiivirga citrea]